MTDIMSNSLCYHYNYNNHSLHVSTSPTINLHKN